MNDIVDSSTKDQYGRSRAEDFIRNYLTTVGLINLLPPNYVTLLAKKLEEEEARLTAPIAQEIKEKGLKDENYITYREKLEKRAAEYAYQDANQPRYKANTIDDEQIMVIHKKEVQPVGEIAVSGSVFDVPSIEEVQKGFIK